MYCFFIQYDMLPTLQLSQPVRSLANIARGDPGEGCLENGQQPLKNGEVVRGKKGGANSKENLVATDQVTRTSTSMPANASAPPT